MQSQASGLSLDMYSDSGPFDIIGDVHGCYDELAELLGHLGYVEKPGELDRRIVHPHGRKLVFVGDLVDRGPQTPSVLKLVMGMVNSGAAYCVIGNHDDKLARKLRGNDVSIAHGLAESLQQLGQETQEFRQKVCEFLIGRPSHYVFDGGRLAVAHAGIPEAMQGRQSKEERRFCLYGYVNGEVDDSGLPVRRDWAVDYRGRAAVVHGHTPVRLPEWVHNTICIDTGCVFGGRLTALRYPERELIGVAARRRYCEHPDPTWNQTRQSVV